MIYSYNRFTSLLESKRIDNLKSKYVDKLGVPIDIFNYWYKENNNSLEWLLKTYVNTTEMKMRDYDTNVDGGPLESNTYYELLSKMAKEFVNNKQNLSVDKISQVKDVNHMREILNEIVDYDNYAEKFFSDEIWVLTNSDNYFIYKAYTYEASEWYGNRKEREHNWCTTYGKEHFRSHLGEEGGLIYVINKFDVTKDWALEVSDGSAIAWDWKDQDEYDVHDLDYLIKKVWKEDEEPYKVLMKHLSELENDIPKVDWEEARLRAQEEIRHMNIKEFSYSYNIEEIWQHMNDKDFLSDMKDSEIERYDDDWMNESDLLDMFTTLLGHKFNETYDWSEKFRKSVFDYFIPLMKEANIENENDYYVIENPDLQDVIIYINESYTDNNVQKLIEHFRLQDDIVEELTSNYMNNYDDAEDYVKSMYGRNVHPDELSWLDQYVDWDSLSKSIAEDMDEEELRNYM